MKTIKIQSSELLSFAIVISIVFLFLASCQKEENEYSPIQYLKISGASSVTANSEKDYYTFYLDDADYKWTVPNGASILSGQGTSHIKVHFGTIGGTLSVEAKGMRAEKDISIIE